MNERRSFSVELNSKNHVKNICLAERFGERVLIEGVLGNLEELGMIEGALLEIKGSNGVIRIDLNEEELRSLFKKKESS